MYWLVPVAAMVLLMTFLLHVGIRRALDVQTDHALPKGDRAAVELDGKRHHIWHRYARLGGMAGCRNFRAGIGPIEHQKNFCIKNEERFNALKWFHYFSASKFIQ